MSANIELEAKEVIWDLDGTIIDSFGIFKSVLNEVLPLHELEIPDRQNLIDNYHGSLQESISNAFGGTVSEAMIERVVVDFLKVQNGHYKEVETHIFPDAQKLVQRLHDNNIFQILVTNRFHEGRLNASPLNIVKQSSLDRKIDVVVCGDDSPHRKPNPEVVSHYIQSGILSPEHAVVIGDQFVDAQFARNLGARAILVSRNGSTIPHLEKLGEDWTDYVTIVSSLDSVNA